MIIVKVPDFPSQCIRAFLDGVDVSADTFYAELPDEMSVDGRGVLEMYVRGDDGKRKLVRDETGRPIRIESKQVFSDRVRWELKDGLTPQVAAILRKRIEGLAIALDKTE